MATVEPGDKSMTQTDESPAAEVRWRDAIRRPVGSFAWFLAAWCGWVSLYPTLLPRSAMIQGAISAISITLGLAFGTLIAWIVRHGWKLAKRPVPAIPKRRGRTLLYLLTVFGVIVGLPWWFVRQNAQRDLVSMDPIGLDSVLVVVIVGLIVGALLFVIGRSVARLVRRIDRGVARLMPRWAARAGTVAVVALLVSFIAQDVVWKSFVNWANSVYSTFDNTTPEGIVQPTTALRSGGPGSLVAWDTLGNEGRNFAGGGPTTQQLQEFAGAGSTVKEPIRAYVGIQSVDVSSDSSELPDVQAQRAVAELDRTDAWNRSVLAVVTVTGTGWVDPWFAASLEYMNHGDTAIVATQYSYLPSWISFLVDLDKAAASGRATVDAVVAKWKTLPVDHRPRLIVDGISLGTYGSEHAFNGSTLNDSIGNALADVDGVLYAGPTFMNPIWMQVVAGRESSSPSWKPVVGSGLAVHAWNRPQDSAAEISGGRLPGRNVLYLTQPSDPVTWAGYSSLWSKPTWMRGQRGYDVPSGTLWFPGVTLVQEVFDLMAGFSTPPGHGHNYNASIVYGVAAVAAPNGWSSADSARLTQLLAATPSS